MYEALKASLFLKLAVESVTPGLIGEVVAMSRASSAAVASRTVLALNRRSRIPLGV